MRKIIRNICLAASLLMVFAITACGSKIESDLTIRDDFSGTRVFTITAEIKDNKQYVDGELKDISATIAENCPSVLSFEDKSDDENAVFVFTMNFDSIESYKQQLKALLDLDADNKDKYTEEVVEYALPSSVFSTGINYNEPYGPKDYMQWFANLMVKAGYVKESDKSNIFYHGVEGKYTIFGQSGESSGAIKIDTIEQLPINCIQVFTDFSGDKYTRKVSVQIPQASMDKRGNDIRTFMESHVNSTAKGEWKEEDGVNTFTVTGTDLTIDALNQMMSDFYGKQGSFITVDNNPSASGNSNGKNIFFTLSETNETCDFSEYLGTTSGRDIEYYVAKTDNLIARGDDDSAFSNYVLLRNNSAEYSFQFKNVLDIESVSMFVICNPDGMVTRQVSLIYNNELSDTDMESLSNRLNDRCENSGISVKECTCSGGKVNVTLESVSKPEKDRKVWNNAFSADNSLTISYSGRSFASFKTTVCYEDIFDLKAFGKEDGTVMVRYETQGFEKVGKQQVTINDQKISEPLVVNLSSSGLNFLGIGLWAATGVLLILAIILFIAFLVKLPKKPKQPKPAVAAQQMPMQPQPMQPQPMQAEAIPVAAPVDVPVDVPVDASEAWVCPQCGTTVARGNFCDTCGSQRPMAEPVAEPVTEPEAEAFEAAAEAGDMSEAWVCAQCGATVASGNFCDTCGSPRMAEPEVEAAEAVEATAEAEVAEAAEAVEAVEAEAEAQVEEAAEAVESTEETVEETVVEAAEEAEAEVEEATEAVAAVEPASEGWTCPQCGHEVAGGNFCDSCGTKRP